MKTKRTLALLLALAMLCAAAPYAAAASPTVEFKASEPDANGYFTVDMTVYNATFNVFQFAVRFDPKKVAPVNTSGNAVDDFDSFAVKKAGWLSLVGTGVDASTGFFKFAGYIMPGTNASEITNGEAVIGSEGKTLFTFGFKVTSDGDPKFRIATKAEGEPYDHSLAEGAAIVCKTGGNKGTVTFNFSALAGGTTASSDIEKSTQKPVYTADSLLEESIILKIGSHAVVADSGVTALYAGEKSVVPYISGDRTFVPLRFISERLGGTVTVDGKKITIVKDETTIVMTVGDKFFTKDGSKVEMDVSAELTESTPGYVRTMVPIRFIAEAFGMSVGWDGVRGLVIVAPGDYEWADGGSLEQQVNAKALSLLTLYSSFV